MNDKYGIFQSITEQVGNLENTFSEFNVIKGKYKAKKRRIIVGVIIITIFIAMIGTLLIDEYLIVDVNGCVQIRTCYAGSEVDDADYIDKFVIDTKEKGELVVRDEFYSFTLSKSDDNLIRSVYDDDYYYKRY